MANENARQRGLDRAAIALHQYDDDEHGNMVDLLTDLMHYCASRRISFDECLNTARMHREAEKGGT